MANKLQGDDVKLSGSTRIRVTREGVAKISADGLRLSGTDAANYTLLGETHEVLIQLKAKFKALKNIENKINELAKSGKKIITGATQAIPKVVAMTSSLWHWAAGAPSLGGGPTGGGSGPSGGGTPTASGGGGSSGASSSGGGDSGSGDSSTEE